MELTRRSGHGSRGIWHEYDVPGGSVKAFDSARNGLLTIELFSDEGLDPLTKEGTFLRMLWGADYELEDPGTVTPEQVSALAWEAFGLDLDGSHESESDGKRAWDWKADARLIKASLFQAYGVPWEELCEAVTFRELTSMMGLVPHDTPLGQAVYYRTADPPKPDGKNQEQIKRWRERAEFWRIKESYETDEERMKAKNREALDAFEAVWKAASRG